MVKMFCTRQNKHLSACKYTLRQTDFPKAFLFTGTDNVIKHSDR